MIMPAQAKRNSSIELLRIVSMLMILFLHATKDMMISNDFDASFLNIYLINCLIKLNL